MTCKVARRHGGTEARRHGGTEARRHGGTEARRHGGTGSCPPNAPPANPAWEAGSPSQRPLFNRLATPSMTFFHSSRVTSANEASPTKPLQRTTSGSGSRSPGPTESGWGLFPVHVPVSPMMDTGCRCTEHHHFPLRADAESHDAMPRQLRPRGIQSWRFYGRFRTWRELPAAHEGISTREPSAAGLHHC